MEKLFLSKLSPETKVWTDDDYYITRTTEDLIEEIRKHPEKYRHKDVYLYELEDMPKPNIANYVENIGEEMDENHENWLDKNSEYLEDLEKEMQIVFDKWRDKNEHEVLARNTEVIIDFNELGL